MGKRMETSQEQEQEHKRNMPLSWIETPTNAEKSTPAGPSKLWLKKAFVSKLICLNGGLAKDDAEKIFEDAYEEALSKE